MTRKFIKVIKEYIADDTNPNDFIGKPYYGIQYEEDGQILVGYGTYRIDVLERWLKKEFKINLRDVEEYVVKNIKVIHCSDCKHQTMSWHVDRRFRQGGYPVWGCDLISDSFTSSPVWGEPNQYCSSAEKREVKQIPINRTVEAKDGNN